MKQALFKMTESVLLESRRGFSFFMRLFPCGRTTTIPVLLSAAILLSGHASAAPVKTDALLPNTTAPVFILTDGESGGVLAEKDGDKAFNPGDMVKLMTAEVVFDAIHRQATTLDTEYEISEHAWQRGRGGSMFALVKSRIRVEDLLRGITVLSADDGAIALAEGLAQSEDSFVQIMNNRAQSIGMKGSFFSNSTGSGAVEQRTTARDLARLGRILATRYPDNYRLYAEKSFTWSKIEQLNRNPLMLLDAGVDGVKAARGTPDGFALVGAAGRDGKRLIVVVANMDSSREAATEAQKILNWGFDNFALKTLFRAQDVVTDVKVYGGEYSRVPLIVREPVDVLWRETGSERLSMRVEYKGPLVAPVREGQQVGALNIMRNGVLMSSVPVYTGAAIARGALYQQAASAMEELAGGMFRTLWRRAQDIMKKKP